MSRVSESSRLVLVTCNEGSRLLVFQSLVRLLGTSSKRVPAQTIHTFVTIGKISDLFKFNLLTSVDFV